MASWAALALIFAGVAWSVLDDGPFNGITGAAVIAALGIQRYARRWQVETIRPRPQTPSDRRDYRRLQYINIAILLAGAAPVMWFALDESEGARRMVLGVAAIVGLVGILVGTRLMLPAYERLFARVAGQDGAYGL